MRHLALCVAVVSVAATTTRSAGAARVSPSPALAAAERFIQAGVDAGLAPSVSIVVVQEDQTIWADAFGFADPDRQRRATIDTPYLLASVTKPLTATGLMVLVDRGLIDLDAPANRYLPIPLRAFAGDVNAMTLRRIGNHSSGLPPHVNFFLNTTPPPGSETLARYGFSFYVPGRRWEYSNLGFRILAFVSERVAGKPWAQFLHDEVFQPAGMTRTFVRLTPERAAIAARPRRTDLAGRSVALPAYISDHAGSSAVWSTAADMARFLRLHLHDGVIDGRRILSAASARTMRQPVADDRSGSPYGLGWRLDYVRGVEVFGHNGNMPGVSTLVRAFPQQRLAYAVLSNGDNEAFLRDIDAQLLEALLPAARAVPRASAAPAFTVSQVAGEWSGRLAIGSAEVSVRLRIAGTDTTTIALGSAAPRPLSNVRVVGDELSARFNGYAQPRPDVLGGVIERLRLWRAGERLQGVCVFEKDDEFELSGWVDLGR